MSPEALIPALVVLPMLGFLVTAVVGRRLGKQAHWVPVIAIFAVAAYYFLLNRVDLLVRDLDDRTRQVIELISSEAIRPGGLDRRPGSLTSSEPLRQETRVY